MANFLSVSFNGRTMNVGARTSLGWRGKWSGLKPEMFHLIPSLPPEIARNIRIEDSGLRVPEEFLRSAFSQVTKGTPMKVVESGVSFQDYDGYSFGELQQIMHDCMTGELEAVASDGFARRRKFKEPIERTVPLGDGTGVKLRTMAFSLPFEMWEKRGITARLDFLDLDCVTDGIKRVVPFLNLNRMIAGGDDEVIVMFPFDFRVTGTLKIKE